MKNIIIVILGVIVIGMVTLGVWYYVSDNFLGPLPTTVTAENSPSLGVTPEISVQTPRAGDLVAGSIQVSGRARAFENTILLKLIDGAGNVITQKPVTFYAPDAGQFGDFNSTLLLPIGITATNLTLQVFEVSAKDGTHLHEVDVPLILGREVQLYFNQTSPVSHECNDVVPVQRIIGYSQTPLQDTLVALLGGPTEKERTEGFISSIPSGVTIQKVTVQNGVAQADFSEKLQQGIGGSCRVSAIRQSIVKTMLQFPSVRQAIISIDGRTADILQP